MICMVIVGKNTAINISPEIFICWPITSLFQFDILFHNKKHKKIQLMHLIRAVLLIPARATKSRYWRESQILGLSDCGYRSIGSNVLIHNVI